MSLLRYEGVDWAVPFLFENQDLYITIIEFLAKIDVDCPIKDVYGYIRNRWNGYEIGTPRMQNIGSFLKTVSYFHANPVINFSNYHLEEQELKDRYCNELLDFGAKIGAKFIVSSDLLYNYIKNKYPNAKLNASEVKSLYELEKGNETEYYKRLYDKYDTITLSENYVKDGFVNDAEKYSDVSKFEVIVNNTCLQNCNKMKEHNECVENFEMGKSEYVNFLQFCPKNQISIKDGISKTLVLSRKELDCLVNDIGIKKLRIKKVNTPMLSLSDVITSYIFNPIGNFQHIGFKLDRREE